VKYMSLQQMFFQKMKIKNYNIFFLLFYFFTFLLFFTSASFASEQSSGIANFRKVSEEFYRGAHPDYDGIAYLKKLGIKTIIDLRSGKAAVSKERKLARYFGIKYVNIPFGPYYRPPADSDIKRFLAIVTDPKESPVFVHCQNGQDRAGMMTAVYRIAVQGWPKENAYAEAIDSGMHFYCWPLKNFILNRVQDFKNYEKKG